MNNCIKTFKLIYSVKLQYTPNKTPKGKGNNLQIDFRIVPVHSLYLNNRSALCVPIQAQRKKLQHLCKTGTL